MQLTSKFTGYVVMGRPHQSSGFTLVELVATIILVGILAVTVMPRFSDRGGVVEYTLRDQLAGLLYQAQQRAMFDRSGPCYSVLINSAGVQMQRDSVLNSPESQILFAGDYAGLSVTTAQLYFDSLGNLLMGGTNCSTSSVPASPITLSVSGNSAAQVIVHPTGYVERTF